MTNRAEGVIIIWQTFCFKKLIIITFDFGVDKRAQFKSRKRRREGVHTVHTVQVSIAPCYTEYWWTELCELLHFTTNLEVETWSVWRGPTVFVSGLSFLTPYTSPFLSPLLSDVSRTFPLLKAQEHFILIGVTFRFVFCTIFFLNDANHMKKIVHLNLCMDSFFRFLSIIDPSFSFITKVLHNQQLQHPQVSSKRLYILWAGYQWHKL